MKVYIAYPNISDPFYTPEGPPVANACFYCRIPIGFKDLQEQIDTGILHIHYCANCIIVCELCGEAKPLYAFPFNFDSKEWQEWQGKGNLPFPAPRESHSKVCSLCERARRRDLERMQREAEEKRLKSAPNTRLLERMRALKTNAKHENSA